MLLYSFTGIPFKAGSIKQRIEEVEAKNPFYSKIQRENTLAGLLLWRVESFGHSCHMTTLAFISYYRKMCTFLFIDVLLSMYLSVICKYICAHRHKACLNHI